MPVNGFTTSRDVTLTIITSRGPLSLSLITGFRSKPDTIEHKGTGLDGVPRHEIFTDGWSGSFTLERQDGFADAYFAQLEADYFAGKSTQHAHIVETIREADGSIAQYQYTRVRLRFDEAGEFRGDSTVKQSISFLASRRLQIA